jgi:hypothetical protein
MALRELRIKGCTGIMDTSFRGAGEQRSNGYQKPLGEFNKGRRVIGAYPADLYFWVTGKEISVVVAGSFGSGFSKKYIIIIIPD